MSSTSDPGDMGLVYKDWAIALGATTAVFLVTTLLLASILFAILCRKITRLRKERNSRETRVLQGVTSPHWIDHANLNDMLEQDRNDHEKPMQNIWAISTQTFDSSRAQQPQPSTTPQPPDSAKGGLTSSQERGEINKSLSVSVSPTCSGERETVKPNRTAPSPPKTRKKSKSRDRKTGKEEERHEEATPYVYPLHKIKQESAQTSTNGNQSHEYAQPHVHLAKAPASEKEPQAQNGNAKKKHEYRAIDPKLKQPTGQYQDLLHNGKPRGNSLPAMSTFAAVNS